MRTLNVLPSHPRTTSYWLGTGDRQIPARPGDAPCRTNCRKRKSGRPWLWHVPLSATSKLWPELLSHRTISLFCVCGSCACSFQRRLPSLHRHYPASSVPWGLSDFPSGPALASRLAGSGTHTPLTAWDLPCCVDVPWCTCRRLYSRRVSRPHNVLPYPGFTGSDGLTASPCCILGESAPALFFFSRPR